MNYIEQINNELKAIMYQTKPSPVQEAMSYALMNGGKRLRPLLFLLVLKAYDVDVFNYLDIAASVEMIHTYSLIHDDLPAMDNDSLRRGKPTTHIAFDEATAILAGDALLTDAFLIIAKNTSLSSDIKIKLIQILSAAAGSKGMIYGQIKDMASEGVEIDSTSLLDIHLHKTGCLIQAPLMMAAMIGNKKDVNAWHVIGYHVGIAFQIQDDLLDVLFSDKTTGKSNSDFENEKSTYVSLHGIEKSKQDVQMHFDKAIMLLQQLTIHHEPMIALLNQLHKREK